MFALLNSLQVLFIHKYSSGMILDSVILISFTYFSSTASMIYVQHLTQGFPEPEIDLKYPEIVLFLIGICGNFYHHYLLSKLRIKGERVQDSQGWSFWACHLPSLSVWDSCVCRVFIDFADTACIVHYYRLNFLLDGKALRYQEMVLFQV